MCETSIFDFYETMMINECKCEVCGFNRHPDIIGLCSFCRRGYYMMMTAECKSCIPNEEADDDDEGCYVCKTTNEDTDKKCRNCIIGFFLYESEGICEKCHANCFTCIEESSCSKWKNGHYMKNVNVRNICEKCFSENDNEEQPCVLCKCYDNDSNDKCWKCPDGSFLIELGGCESCSTNCLICADFASSWMKYSTDNFPTYAPIDTLKKCFSMYWFNNSMFKCEMWFDEWRLLWMSSWIVSEEEY